MFPARFNIHYGVLAPSLAQTADPQFADQIAMLQQQGAVLQKELSVFKAIINRASDLTIRIIAQQHKQEVTEVRTSELRDRLMSSKGQ